MYPRTLVYFSILRGRKVHLDCSGNRDETARIHLPPCCVQICSMDPRYNVDLSQNAYTIPIWKQEPPPYLHRMSCSFLKVGAKASDNLTAVEVGSFSSKVLTTFVGPCPTRIWRWLVICRWERWAFLLLVIVTTLKDFFLKVLQVVQWIFMKIVSLYSTWEGWGFPVSIAMLVFWRVVVVADHCFWSTRWEWGIILERECL